MKKKTILRSRHFFGAATASKVRDLGANSGSDQIGSVPAPGKNRRLRLRNTENMLRYFIVMFLFMEEVLRIRNISLDPDSYQR